MRGLILVDAIGDTNVENIFENRNMKFFFSMYAFGKWTLNFPNSKVTSTKIFDTFTPWIFTTFHMDIRSVIHFAWRVSFKNASIEAFDWVLKLK